MFGGAETGLPELFLKDTLRILKRGRSLDTHVWFMSVGRPRMFADFFREMRPREMRRAAPRVRCTVHARWRGGLRVL